jgi:hypothetical protein
VWHMCCLFWDVGKNCALFSGEQIVLASLSKCIFILHKMFRS